MQKRGALELSVNTIVIVVIGVALLSLGLIFVRNTFGGLTKMSDDIFGTADTQIGKLHSGARLTVPTTINVKTGSVVRANIFVGNDGTRCTANTFKLTLGDSGASQVCNTGSTICAKIISKDSLTIAPGEEGTYVVAVAATKAAPLSSGNLGTDVTVGVIVTCGGSDYDTSAFTINVQKGGGLFS
ncbi:MAG: hypothetical protein V1645_02845 [archaeon]